MNIINFVSQKIKRRRYILFFHIKINFEKINFLILMTAYNIYFKHHNSP